MFAPFVTHGHTARGADGADAARAAGGAERLPEPLPAAARSPLSVVPALAPESGPALVLSRAAARMRTAARADELCELVAGVVRAAFGRDVRFELFLAGEDRALEPAVHRTGDEARASRQLLAAVRTRLLAVRAPLADPQLLGAAQTSGRRSAMTAPLLDHSDGLRGLLVLEAAPEAPDFSGLDLVALEGLAALASAALLRIDAREGGRRTRLELDRTAARRVQRGFMSSTLPPGIGITAHAEYLPAFDVGGDFYGVRYLPDRTVSVAIGDVSGNGVSAALLMSRVTSDLERAAEAGKTPSAVLAAVNERLAGAEADMFVTVACLRIDPASRRLTVANAGHLPLLLRRANGEVFTFGGASGMPLGMLPCEYQEEDLRLEPGDIVLLVTDGLLEALDHPSGHRGMELLLDELHAAPHDPAAIDAGIRATVDRARLEHALDDVTWVTLQVAR